MQKEILRSEAIQIQYDDVNIIDGVNFDLKEGEKMVITGQSGHGKTSLIHALLGFVPLHSGKIFWFGKELNAANKDFIRSRIAWLPQDTSIYFESIREMIDTLFRFKNNKKMAPTEIRLKKQLLSFGLEPDMLDRKTDEISGGQQQRLLLAVILLLKKPVLILDEPTSDLDEQNRMLITDMVLSKKNTSVIAISHDSYWIEKSDKIIAL